MSRRLNPKRRHRAEVRLRAAIAEEKLHSGLMKQVNEARAALEKARDALAAALRDREKLLDVLLALYESNDHSPISDARIAARELLRQERLIP